MENFSRRQKGGGGRRGVQQGTVSQAGWKLHPRSTKRIRGEGKGRRKKKHRQITGCFACSSVCLLACPIGETKHRLRQVIGPTLNRSKQKTTHVPLPPLPPASARATSPPCPRSRPFSEAFQQRPALAHSPPLRSRLH